MGAEEITRGLDKKIKLLKLACSFWALDRNLEIEIDPSVGLVGCLCVCARDAQYTQLLMPTALDRKVPPPVRVNTRN